MVSGFRARTAKWVYLAGAIMLGSGGFLLVAVDYFGFWSQTPTVGIGRMVGSILFLLGILGLVVSFIVEPRGARTR